MVLNTFVTEENEAVGDFRGVNINKAVSHSDVKNVKWFWIRVKKF